jgi:IS1 family transposase
LPCKRLKCDEIWSFVAAKEQNVPFANRGDGRGDVWTWTAICLETKLVPCWYIGARDLESAVVFLEDLASRLAARVEITTDASRAYLTTTPDAFRRKDKEYALLVKLYGALGTTVGSGQSGAAVNSRRLDPFDAAHLSSSNSARAHLTMRMNMRRFIRQPTALSKKLENHMYAVSLHLMNYNFCRPHAALTKAARGIHTTPAIAAGVTDRVWTIEDVVEMADRNSR